MPLRSPALLIAAVFVAGSAGFAQAQVKPPRTFVSLSGQADPHPRLGNPAIHVEVRSPVPSLADGLADALTADLEKLAYSRPGRDDSPFDYRLGVVLDPPVAGAPGEPLRFTATMDSPERGIVWRTEGRTELDGRPIDPEVISSVSKNLVSALLHDGWIVARLDAEDPPPSAPRIKISD